MFKLQVWCWRIPGFIQIMALRIKYHGSDVISGNGNKILENKKRISEFKCVKIWKIL
jgi:hypothetical protein